MGWRGESRRHSLARKGIKTVDNPCVRSMKVHGINSTNQDMINKAIAEFELTDDFNEAGYILPNGEMLDFSGSNQGAMGGSRERDHREITIVSDDLSGGTKGMDEFMDQTGSIRFSLNDKIAQVDVMHPITRDQEKTLNDVIEITNGNLEVDLENGLGEWSSYSEMYVQKPDNKQSLSFEDDSRQRILGSINRFYNQRRDR